MDVKKANEDKDTKLEALRVEIDECDKHIIKHLVRRFELARKVGIYKAIHSLPVLDETRETQILADRNRQASEIGDYPVEEIFRLIIEESRQVQIKVRDELGMSGPCC